MIIGKDTMLPISYLEKGSICSKGVGRITTYPYNSMGTGFMISGGLLTTCHHVIPDLVSAANSTFQLDYFVRSDGTFNKPIELKLDPNRFFVTSKDLDITVVAISPSFEINIEERCITNVRQEELTVGGSVSIIHHPQGEPQKISLLSGEIKETSGLLLRYDTPTTAGSAGAPIFNDQWELIGIHHAGGQLDSLAYPSVKVFLNEGIRASAFMKWLEYASQVSPTPHITEEQGDAIEETGKKPGNLHPIIKQVEEEKQERDSVFISYAHKDQEKVEWQDELEKYIKNVAIIGPTRVWYDERINAGSEWRVEIETALRKTKVAILLVGPHFLNSDFILNKELPDLLDAAKNEGVKIIPLITHRVPYHRSILGKFQSFNSPDKPLQEQRKNDAIKTLNEVVEVVAKEYDTN